MKDAVTDSSPESGGRRAALYAVYDAALLADPPLSEEDARHIVYGEYDLISTDNSIQ